MLLKFCPKSEQNMPEYPTDLPKQELLDLAIMIRHRRLLEDKAKSAKAIWLLIGYIQYRTLGEPVLLSKAPFWKWFKKSELSDDEAADCLENLVIAQGYASIPWLLLLRWAIKLLLRQL
jgi:hypothetical protein